ncbi:MAG: hypothetical protein WB755_18785 [Terriglobales bacterium]
MKSIPLELKTNALESSNTPARTSMAVMAVIAWFALGLQFYLMVIRSDAQGAALLRLIANYFSFLRSSQIFSLPSDLPGRWWRRIPGAAHFSRNPP